MEVEVPVGVQQFWVQTVDQRNSILDLPLQDHLPDLNSFIEGVQIHAGLNSRLHPEFLCSLLEALCQAGKLLFMCTSIFMISKMELEVRNKWQQHLSQGNS